MVQLLEKPIRKPLRGVEAKRNADFGDVDDLVEQIKHLIVVDLPSQLCLQNIVRDAVEEMMDVHFQGILRVLRVLLNPFLYSLLRLVSASFWQARVAVLIHTMPEHLIESHHNTMLNNELFQRRYDDGTFFILCAVVDLDRSMRSILIVDDPLPGQLQKHIVGEITPFNHLADALRAFGFLDSTAPVLLRETNIIKVFVGFHGYLSYPLIRFRLFQILTDACTELIFTER